MPFKETQLDWQTIVALFIVLTAVVVFVWKVLSPLFKGTSGCGTSCDSCPSSKPSEGVIKITKLIQLDEQ